MDLVLGILLGFLVGGLVAQAAHALDWRGLL